MTTSKKKALRVLSFILVLVSCLSLTTPLALAEGSLYISHYSVSMSAGSGGNVTAWFQITGTGNMDQIGAILVYIYENGTQVKTFSSSTTSGMMAYNTNFHGSSVTYKGTVGKSYSALVVFQAGKDGDWDNRSMSTNSVTAKN